jgi:HYR domain-containing protein/chitobiase/beta-hexosaminidase-like protein
MASATDGNPGSRKSPVTRAAVLAVAGVFVFAAVAFADSLLVDGDGTAPVTANFLNMGQICSTGSKTKPAAVAIQASNHPGGVDVFAPGSTVTFTPTDSAPSLSGTSGSLVIPADWLTAPNGAMTPDATVQVTMRGGTIGAQASDWMAYTAVGRNPAGDPLSRTTWLNVRAAFIFCADTTPPVLSLPANQTIEATSSAGAAVTFATSATDANPTSPAVTCSPASGSAFPIGTTTVRCSATDAAGNTATGTFTLTVADTGAPVLSLPSNITVSATGTSGAVVTFAVSATDLSPASPDVTCTPVSGSAFPIGTTTVRCSATDAAGNTSTGTFTVSVLDGVAPTVSVSLSPATPSGDHGWYSAPVTVTVSASDNVAVATVRYTLDGTSATYAGPFAVGDGTHTLTATATDGSGNSVTSAAVSFKVDTTAPAVSLSGGAGLRLAAITPDDLTCQTVDALSGVATEAVLVITGGSGNGVGTFTATCTGAMDNAGNQSAAVSVTFGIGYGAGSGILPPIAPGSDRLLVRGQTVPVKFRLPGDERLRAGFNSSAWTVEGVRVDCRNFGTVLGTASLKSTSNHTGFRFSGDRYIFNADLRALERGTCWQIRVTLDDGTELLSGTFQLTGKGKQDAEQNNGKAKGSDKGKSSGQGDTHRSTGARR